MKKLISVLKFVATDRQTFAYFAYALLVLFILFALTYAAFHPLLREAKLVATDTVPSLIYGSEVNNALDDNFVRVLLIAQPQFTNEISDVIRQIDAATRNNDLAIEQYRRYISEEEDRRNFDAFVAERNRFLAKRKQVLENARTHPEQLTAEIKSVLLPAYQKYRDAGRTLIKYSARVGQERGDRIRKYAVSAILFTIIAPVFVIFGGIVLGIRIFKL